MEKLTKQLIEKMANEIAQYCYDNEYGDVILYYNGNQRFVDYYGHERDEIVENVNPHDYFDYCAYNHIFSMSSEGFLDLEYELLNEKGIDKIFHKYGLYAELGNSWNCSCYLLYDDMEVEYTIYEIPKEKIYILRWKNYDSEIMGLIDTYNKAIEEANPKCNGSCIIGDGINFELNGQPYKFDTNYNQSDAVDSVINACKEYLQSIGATNIWYDCGRMD